MGRKGWALTVTIALLIVPSTIFAQQKAPAADAQEERDQAARRNFKVGQAAYQAGQYEDALRYFERAYELSPRPQLLYNIGQSADRLRLDQRALDAFQGYLLALP